MADPRDIDAFYASQTVAVVGASRDPAKWGRVVFDALRARGKTVWAVNPSTTEIDGQPCYPDLHTLPGRPDAVVCVVPPRVTLGVVRDVARRAIPLLWLQPGAEDAAVLAECQQLNVRVVAGVCLIHSS